jgi:4-hydroxymandelate oxidase
VEDIAKAAGFPVWFQLYVQRDRGFTRDLVQRAEDAGCRALCVTVDSPVFGPRNREERAKGELPERELPNLKGKDYLDPTLTWKDIDWLRSFAKRPVLLKGILNPDDAVKAASMGVDGIIVSNHGARNLDTVPAHNLRPPVHRRACGRAPAGAGGRRNPAWHRCVEGARTRRHRGSDRPSVSLGVGSGGIGRCRAGGRHSAARVRNGNDAGRQTHSAEH